MTYIARNVLSLPLKGTDKQVAWSRTIRAQKVAFFEHLGNRAVLREIRPLLVEGEVNAMNALSPVKLGWIATLTVVMALSSEDARWWIDHRDEDPLKWLAKAYGEVLLHLIRNPLPDV
jgi:hypothetical protein